MEFKQIVKSLLQFGIIFIISCESDYCGFFIYNEDVNDRVRQSLTYNATTAFKILYTPSEQYTLFIISDSHVGGTHNIRRFLSDANGNNALATVLVGDLCNGHTEEYDTLQQVLNTDNTIPYFPLIGNHDLFFNGWESFYKIFGSSVYYFSVQTPSSTDLYVCLDSGSGTHGSIQLQWFENLLKTSRSKFRHCVVFTHCNLFRIRRTLSTNPNMEEINIMNDLSARYQIEYVITGHDHIYNEIKLGNTIHITLDALSDSAANASYLELIYRKGSLSHRIIPIN